MATTRTTNLENTLAEYLDTPRQILGAIEYEAEAMTNSPDRDEREDYYTTLVALATRLCELAEKKG